MLEIKNGKYVSKTFRIPLRICVPMERLAMENDLPLNKLVIQFLEYALNEVQTQKESITQATAV